MPFKPSYSSSSSSSSSSLGVTNKGRKITVALIVDKKERKKNNDETRNQFSVKFGHLKKASVLLFYGRVNAAHEEIVQAVSIIQKQEEKEKEANQAAQKHWQEKLKLQDGFELPNGLTYETIRKEDITDKFIKELSAEAG